MARLVIRTLLSALLAMNQLSVAREPVSAGHSIPQFYPRYWDCNGDLHADDGCVYFRLGGSGWTTAYLDRVNRAFYEWRSSTNWDPFTNQNVTGDIFIDRDVYHPQCPDYDWSEVSQYLVAVTCRIEQWTPAGPGGGGAWASAHWRITEAEIYFSNDPSVDWWVGWQTTPSGRWDFDGTLTHELGHAVYLLGLECAAGPGPTMCDTWPDADLGAPRPTSIGVWSFRQRTLDADDVEGAEQYPCC